MTNAIKHFRYISLLLALAVGATAAASISHNEPVSPYKGKAVRGIDTMATQSANAWRTLFGDYQPAADTITETVTAETYTVRTPSRFPAAKYGPLTFKEYTFTEEAPLRPIRRKTSLFPGIFKWLDDYSNSNAVFEEMEHEFLYSDPADVRYNAADMPEVPKEYRAYVDEVTTRIVFEERKVDDKNRTTPEPKLELKHWLHSFDGSLQFSQAYISPNWYQGGNNNLNMIGQLIYNVKLNQKFYPKLLFDATVSYKLALNSAPDDSIHSFNISEDILQVNATFGLKAARNWYYSANLLFKTQLLNSYPTNSRSLQAAFMSPGELNVGLGMTYSYTNKKKTVKFGTSISPLSWNMKTCTNNQIDPTAYGLEAGQHVKNKVGSSAECTLDWKVAYNITYHSRLFLFTDYEYAYGDWEHNIDFAINRFLSTRLYVHMRYDTSSPAIEGSKWHKFQLKEIFSFGFAYHFGTI
ncbi:MAG: DUF3078 domain-containing protein [Bacteroides sp.]|nr:DUF3078 domain-containing protein [Bacteroides sp.]MCM1414279.1 DUF3078 domain-containing protein [Bacteroides sp.]